MTTVPASTPPEMPPFKRILFCTDFSENADFAFFFALDAAKRRPDSILYLLHVIPEPEAQFWKTYIYEVEGVDEKARQDIDRKISDAYESRIPESQRFEVVVRIGKDYLEILRFAEEHDVDLIVIGRQGHSAVTSMFFGRVTERVVRKAECPVLVVPVVFRKRRPSDAGN